MEMLHYILPALALLLFAFPKKRMGYCTLLLVIVFSYPVVAGVLGSLFSLNLPQAMILSPLAAVFAIPLVFVSVSVSIYMCGYLKEYLEKKSRMETAFHCLFFLLLYLSMLGVLSSSTKFDFLFYWELMSLSSFALMLWNGEGNRKSFHAALGYIVLMHLGFFLLLFGFYLLPAGQGLMGYGSMPFYVWILFFLGFGIKVGMFPVHGWLPVAHPAAPSHVSAMMSAAMLNMGIYGIFKATLGASDVFATGIVLFAVGAVTSIFGAYRSALETNLKTLLAYSSMDNMGIILLAIGLGAIGKAAGSFVLAYCGYCGALIHMLCHSSFKTSLFMCAGSVQQASGSLNLDSLGGLVSKMPRTAFFFLVAAMSAMSIPPLSGFSGEFVILGGIFTSFPEPDVIIFSLLALVVISIVVGMTVTSMVKAFSRSMLSLPRVKLAVEPKESNGWMLAGMCLSFVFILVGGCLFPCLVLSRSSVICAVLDAASMELFVDSFLMISLLCIVLIALTYLLYGLKKKRKVRYEETWSCGASDLPGITQVGASSFSGAMSSGLMSGRQIFQSDNAGSGLFSVPEVRNRIIRDVVSKDLTRLLSGLMHGVSLKFAVVQTGKVYHYVSHALLFIVVIFLLSLFGLM